jgi:hypothetical protein
MNDSTESINFCDLDDLSFVNEKFLDEKIEIAASALPTPYKSHFL